MPILGSAATLDTIPCGIAKSYCPLVKHWSKLACMHDQATKRDAKTSDTTNRITEASRDQAANQQLGETNREARWLGQRHTVKEAAEALGTSVDAIRGRIRRGTLDSVKLDGVVYVLLDKTNRQEQSDKSETEANVTRQPTGDQSELVGELRGQIDWLRREVERKDTIIMQMAQRIPELEAAPEPREATDAASEGTDRVETIQEAPELSERRSWLSRFFFGP